MKAQIGHDGDTYTLVGYGGQLYMVGLTNELPQLTAAKITNNSTSSTLSLLITNNNNVAVDCVVQWGTTKPEVCTQTITIAKNSSHIFVKAANDNSSFTFVLVEFKSNGYRNSSAVGDYI